MNFIQIIVKSLGTSDIQLHLGWVVRGRGGLLKKAQVAIFDNFLAIFVLYPKYIWTFEIGFKKLPFQLENSLKETFETF